MEHTKELLAVQKRKSIRWLSGTGFGNRRKALARGYDTGRSTISSKRCSTPEVSTYTWMMQAVSDEEGNHQPSTPNLSPHLSTSTYRPNSSAGSSGSSSNPLLLIQQKMECTLFTARKPYTIMFTIQLCLSDNLEVTAIIILFVAVITSICLLQGRRPSTF